MSNVPVEPTVSIVLPVYNGERYLRESVQSCLDQSFGDLELICVDDASTDGTAGVLAEVEATDPRIRCVRHSENRKLPAALNTGFDLASGRYLTWTSDDNLYYPHAIETMVSFLDTHGDADLVYAGYRTIDETGREVATTMPPDLSTLFSRNIIGACFMYRRRVHEALGGYREEMFLAEDYDFWLRAALAFRLLPLDEVLYTYRCHSSRLGRKFPRGVIEARRAALMDIAQEGRGLGASERARAHLSIAQASAALEDAPRVRASLRAALAARPLWALRHAGRFPVVTALLGTRAAGWLRRVLTPYGN
ncbi:MAG: glycosyltransferase family 2 protein [Armatimonadota bacterium]|jgi:glycosyltransferase involved in cell wall biosynthesis